MSERENLIALLANAIAERTVCTSDGKPVTSYKYRMVDEDSINLLADYLIANGVTIQRWIPVTERLPEPFVSVVVHMPLEEPMPTVHEGFLVDEEKWYAAHFDREKDEISHWMPLPEPPVEEQNRARGGERMNIPNGTCALGEKGCFTDGKCYYNRNCENKVVTHADRIRAMSDEELAACFGGRSFCSYIQDETDICENRLWCSECIIEWLKRPVKDGEYDG